MQDAGYNKNMKNTAFGFILVAFTGFYMQAYSTDESAVSLYSSKKTPEINNYSRNDEGIPLLTSRVVRIIDGDTIVVEENGLQEKVRLIGINTPESVDPRKKVECFGKEASAFATLLLLGKEVRLESDTSQDDRDKYGRLLRFVFLFDGTLANHVILAEGYGHEYTYKNPHRYQNDFRTAEADARQGQKGLWAENACLTIL